MLHRTLAQAGIPEDLCVRAGLEEEEVAPDALCELLYRATGNEVVARFAGVIGTALRVLVILAVAFILARLVGRLIGRFATRMERRIAERLAKSEERGAIRSAEQYRTRRSQRLHAITGVMRGVVGVTVWSIAILVIIVEVLGIALQPILAGAGLLSVVIGFGAQQMIRDVLAGIAMLVEDQYGVGDWIQIEERVGQVERVGLRSTAFRDMDGIVWHVLNGDVQRVGNLSQRWSRSTIDVPVALDADVPTAKAIIYKIAVELTEDPVWKDDIIGPPEIWGVQAYGPEGLAIRVVMPTRPMANWDINRQMRERLHHAFTQAGIRQPSQLVAVAGQASGSPLHTREARYPSTVPTVDRRRSEPVVPEETGGLIEPAPVDLDEVTGIAYEDERDRTAELRLSRGREPRPD
ncbi:MAG: mechanosensitive ion channel family protein [Nitriliruptor sp.]